MKFKIVSPGRFSQERSTELKMTDKEKIDAAKRIKVVILSKEDHCGIVIRIIHRIIRKLKIWPFEKLDSPRLHIQKKSSEKTTTWKDLKADFRRGKASSDLRKWDWFYTKFTTHKLWNVERGKIFKAFLGVDGKLKTEHLDSLYNCLFISEQVHKKKERAARIAEDDDISMDEFTRILWSERPDEVKDAEDFESFSSAAYKWLKSMTEKAEKEQKETKKEDAENKLLETINDKIDKISDKMGKGFDEMKGEMKTLSKLMVNLTLDANENHRIPHKVIILPGCLAEAKHLTKSEQGQETDSKRPVIEKQGLSDWISYLYNKGTELTTDDYLLWLVDEGWELLDKPAPTDSAKLKCPFNGPFELKIPNKMMQTIAPYLRFVTTLLIGAQAVAGIAGMDSMIPTDQLQAMDIDENLWKELSKALPPEAKKEAEEFPAKEQKVFGRVYKLLQTLILNKDEDKQPKDQHGLTVQYYLDRGLLSKTFTHAHDAHARAHAWPHVALSGAIQRVIKDNKTLHFVSTAHTKKELEDKGYQVHEPLVGRKEGETEPEAEEPSDEEDSCCVCGSGGGTAKVSPAPRDAGAAVKSSNDEEVIDRQPAATAGSD